MVSFEKPVGEGMLGSDISNTRVLNVNYDIFSRNISNLQTSQHSLSQQHLVLFAHVRISCKLHMIVIQTLNMVTSNGHL